CLLAIRVKPVSYSLLFPTVLVTVWKWKCHFTGTSHLNTT
ncbi:ostA-like family protein, partial [Vibrio parahaemolyticus V-223/04]